MVSLVKLYYGVFKIKAFSFATHLFENGTDLRYLGTLENENSKTTEI